MQAHPVSDLASARPLVSIRPDETLEAACDRMACQCVGALPVLEDGILVGILSERDIIRHVSQCGGLSGTHVAAIMTSPVVTIAPEASAADAFRAMRAGGFRHLLVVAANGTVIGMVSIRDIPTEVRLLRERYESWRALEVVE